MDATFVVFDANGPPFFAPTGPWTDALTNYVLEHQIIALHLNAYRGWRGTEGLSFLASLPHLEMLEVLDHRLSELKPIETLQNLRQLSLLTGKGSKLDFSKLPKLENCGIQAWGPGLQGVLSHESLTELYLYAVPIHTLDPLVRLRRLQTLRIKTSAIKTLSGVEKLVELRRIEFMGLTKLLDISSLASLRNLQKLRIDTSRKIARLDDLSPLHSLRSLSIDNCGSIESLKPVSGLTNLEVLSFIESTDILDGDMSVLRTLPRLKDVGYRDRRHYSHTKEQVRQWLLSRDA